MSEKGKKRKNSVWDIMNPWGWFWFGFGERRMKEEKEEWGCFWFRSGVVFYLGLEKGSGEERTIGLEKEERRKDRENMKKEEQERNSSV